MTTLRVIAEDAVAHGLGSRANDPASAPAARSGAIGRYSAELTRALIATAPMLCDVELVFAARPRPVLDEYLTRFRGAASAYAAPLARQPLAAAWSVGARVPIGGGLIHSPGLLAPLTKHKRVRPRTQVVVTIHDTLAWTHPLSLPLAESAWTRAMARRAAKHADAIVVPTHAVAAGVAELLDVGDRLRVIGGAVSPDLVLREDADARAAALGLPERYVLAIGPLDPRRGIDELVRAAALPGFGGLPLLVVGDDERRGARLSGLALEAGLPEGRVRALGPVSDADLAVLLSRATVFAAPALAEGFGLSVLEAMTFGAPVVHSDAPAIVEIADHAGLTVPLREHGSSYAERLAEAIGQVLSDESVAARMRVTGLDRARAFSWRDSANRVWQLHAEL